MLLRHDVQHGKEMIKRRVMYSQEPLRTGKGSAADVHRGSDYMVDDSCNLHSESEFIRGHGNKATRRINQNQTCIKAHFFFCYKILLKFCSN